MRKRLLKMTLALLASFLLGSALMAQGTYGNTQLFDFRCADGVWSTTALYKVSKAGYNFAFTTLKGGDCNRASKTFNGVAITGAFKPMTIDVSSFSSLGQLNFCVNNGSSTADGFFLTYVSSDSITWTKVDSVFMAKGAALYYSPSMVISKSPVKAVRITFSTGPTFWVYGINAYDHKDAANGANAPALLSVTPAEGAYLPADGTISLQFDELMKVADLSKISLGNAAITSAVVKGNTVVLSYTGYTNSTNPLLVQAAALTDYSGSSLSSDISKNYAIDVTPPTYSSSSVANGSTIHINDLGVDANKIKLTFNEAIKIGTGNITFVSNNGTTTINGTVTPTVSGSVLTIGFAGLQYNATNTLTVPASLITDLSGNALTSDVVLTFTTGARDAVAPTLSTQSMTAGATAQPIGGGISFTFNEIVHPGTVPATVNGSPVKLSNNGMVIGLNYTNMPYGSTVTVDIPAGAVTDTCGNQYAGTSFTFTTVAKTGKQLDFIVDKNATPSSTVFNKIQAAIDAVPSAATTRTFIYVKPGVYKEKITILKDKVSLIGEDPDKVIISWNECSSTSSVVLNTGITAPGTDASYTMLIGGKEFYGENFTVRNDYKYAEGKGVDANRQAVALEHKGGTGLSADKGVLKNVKMFSFQDTYYPKVAAERQYLLNCYIQGGTDFIFGSGTCYIDQSTIKCVQTGQYITAPSDATTEFGIVLNQCAVSKSDTVIYDDAANPSNSQTLFALGRPWGSTNAKSAFVNCSFGLNFMRPAGWAEWAGGSVNHLKATFVEYNSAFDVTDAAANLASRVSWSKQLTAKEAARHDYHNAFNYGAGNVWNPIPYCTAPATPSIASMSLNGVLSWNDVDFAVGYLVYRNDTLVASVTSPTYTATNVNLTDVYKVAAYNEYGAASARSQGVVSSIKNAVAAQVDVLQYTVVDKEIVLKNPDYYATVEIVNAAGQRLLSKDITSAYVYVGNFPKGTYYVRACTKLNECRVESFVKK